MSFRRSAKLLLTLLLTFALALAGAFAWFWLVTPDPSALKEADPQTTSFLQQRCKTSSAEGCVLRWTPLPKMSPFVPQAVLLAEDVRFFRHGGLDFRSLKAALKTNWRSGKVVWGGSTITQQLAKNLYLGSEKTVGRKLRETILTLKLERKLSKTRILEIYLNVAQWGPSTFGITNAARHFFDKTPAELGPLEASYLASILPNPEHADEAAWKERFTEVGARIFDALLQSYLPQVRFEAVQPGACDRPPEETQVQATDYAVAKIFSTFANEILTGKAALLSEADLAQVLSAEEQEFVKRLWEDVRGLRKTHPVSCRREASPPENALVPILQPSPVYGQRSFWIPAAASEGVASLLQDARAEGLPLYVTSAYRGAGYQTYLFLATLRQNAHCLATTAREVALPEESEHACLDTPAVDFGALGDEALAFEDTETSDWLLERAPLKGFTLTYPWNNPFGMRHEPWHWKWLGKD